MPTLWPQQVDWPSAAFLQELRAQAYTHAVRILAHPTPTELDINEQTLHGYQLTDLVIEFDALTIHLDANRRSHYYRVKHNVMPPLGSARTFPLFVYAVEFSPEGEFWDEFFYPF